VDEHIVGHVGAAVVGEFGEDGVGFSCRIGGVDPREESEYGAVGTGGDVITLYLGDPFGTGDVGKGFAGAVANETVAVIEETEEAIDEFVAGDDHGDGRLTGAYERFACAAQDEGILVAQRGGEGVAAVFDGEGAE